ncbi:phosphotransferase [Nocardia fluminea]|uniref:phosphotransferase n=1 Tax=Nocardia fluminea TaxID=134984 RepID=UPI0033CC4E44
MHAIDLCADWLDQVLHARGLLGPRDRVTDLTITPIGTGLVADSYQLGVSYSPEARAPGTFVAKLTSDNEQSRAAGRSELNYAREVGFYREIADHLPVRVPKCLHCEIDSNNTEFVLLLEDLSPARAGNQLAGCSINETVLAVEQAARLHAPYWGSTELQGKPWLDISATYWQRFAEMMPGWYEGFLLRYADRLDRADIELGQAFVDDIATYYEAMEAMPYTVQHGDFRPDNVLFDAHGGADPLVVLDWQTVLYAPGVVDVAYFVGGALPVDVRRAHEEDLLRKYYDELVGLGVTEYTPRQLRDDYACATFHNFVIGVAASMLVERTERGDDLFVSMVGNALRHARDRDGAGRLGLTHRTRPDVA